MSRLKLVARQNLCVADHEQPPQEIVGTKQRTNMAYMSVTLEVSHAEMSWLKRESR